MTLGERIQKARIEKKLTQKELASELTKLGNRVAHSTISNWELGIREPDVGDLEILANFFEVTIDDLIRYETKKIYVLFIQKECQNQRRNYEGNKYCRKAERSHENIWLKAE